MTLFGTAGSVPGTFPDCSGFERRSQAISPRISAKVSTNPANGTLIPARRAALKDPAP